jgi:type IV secretory pathway VirJ component
MGAGLARDVSGDVMTRLRRGFAALAAVAALGAGVVPAQAQTTDTIAIRGHQLTLHLYGPRDGPPVVVSSGDGGWIHLAPHVAETLASRGFRVVGVDVKAYLSSFTSGATTLGAADEPRDYATIAAYAARGGAAKPVLVGVSEGGGLSVLAATDPATQARIAGVVGLGLPDLNELGWRWRDSLIYVTHGMPNEPTFSTAAVADRVAPLPLAAIHSTNDEFVPLVEAQRVMDRAHDPKRLWIVAAADHRFSDNLAEFDARLLDALAWVRAHQP